MKTFEGLNVSSKFAICGMPIRIDSYKTCSFGCKYCFANGRKVCEFKKELQIANIPSIERRLKKIFDKSYSNDNDFLNTLIANRITWHFGGMSDPFQPVNEELKITNQIIDITRKYGITILFSTKSDNLHNANITPELHSFQMSVSNIGNRKDIEPNVPDIEKRYELFKRLKKEGFKVGIRIQPFIPNVSGLEIIKMFEGADHFTIEGLKIVPQNQDQKDFIFNTLNFSPDMFTQMGLLNLKPEIRWNLYQPIIEYMESNRISYSISDNDMRWASNNRCCCGDLLVPKPTTFNTTSMIMKYGKEYTKEDVFKEMRLYGVEKCKCADLFTSNRINGRNNVKNFYLLSLTQENSPCSTAFQYFPAPTLF